MKNPLIKRIPRELKSDWHKYLVIIVFMVIMIGVISGMYVGHDSMLAAIEEGKTELVLEDGSFELVEKASQDLLDDISSGEKADVRSYYIEKGYKEADKKVAEAVEDELEQQVTETIEETVRAQCAAFGENMRGFYDSGTNGRELMNHWLVKNCFGDFYTRKGLTMAERELITFCFIAAQGGCEAQLRAHTGGNVHCGRTRKFMIDVVSSNLPFIGYPRTLNALSVVTEVMPEA